MARFFLYQNITKPTGDFPNPEDITVDKWFEPLSEPQRFKVAPALAIALIASGLTWTPIEILAPPSERVAPTTSSSPIHFRQRFIYQSLAHVPFNEDRTIEAKWHEPWSEPKRRTRSTPVEPPFVATVSESITPDKWFAALSEPVRVRRLPTALQQFVAVDTEPTVSFSWYVSLSDPPKRKTSIRTGAQQSDVIPPFVEDSTFESKWHQPWSEPVRFKRGLPTYQQPFEAATSIFPTEVIFEDKWHFPWSEPVRLRRLSAAQQQTIAAVPFNEDTTFEPKWHQGWPDKLYPKRGLSAAQQAFFFYDPFPFVAEVITLDKWWEPLAEPVRQKPGLRASLQDTTADIAFNEDPGNQAKWYEPWSEPVRQKKGLRSPYQISLIWGYFTPEATTPDKWFLPLSEPVRIKPALRAGSQQAFGTDTDPIVSFSWFNGLNEPPKPKVTIRLGSQQFAAVPPFNEDTTLESKWHQAWSEPVRFHRLPTAQQQDLAWEPVFVSETIFEDKWHFPWSEPVRQKRGLVVYEQQSFAFNPQPIVTFSYYNWLTEPVRLKKGLAARYQQPVAQPPSRPILPDLRNAWFEPLSEPVRQKKGLIARLQQFFNFDTKPITPAVTAVLAATETNADTAAIYAVVYNSPVRAVVSIKEITTDAAWGSIQEG